VSAARIVAARRVDAAACLAKAIEDTMDHMALVDTAALVGVLAAGVDARAILGKVLAVGG
jgi:hypothetical protein